MAEYNVKAVLSAYDKGFTSGFKKAQKSVDSLGSKVRSGIGFGVLAGIGAQAMSTIARGVASLIGEVNESNSAWKTFEGNMSYLGKSAAEIQRVRGAMEEFAQKTIYSSSQMAGTFAQLEAAGVGSMKKLTNGTEGVVKGLGGLAATAQKPAQAMKTLSEQTTQMAARPQVAWQDLKLMMEQAPAGIAAVAKQMGMSSQELISQVQAGKVSTEDFLAAVEAAGNSDALQGMATQYKTIGDAMDGLRETLGSKLAPAWDMMSQKAITGISGIVDMVGQLDSSNLGGSLVSMLQEVGPQMLEQGKSIATQMLNGLITGIPQMASAGASLINSIAGGLAQGVPNLIGNVMPLLSNLSESLRSGAGTLVSAGCNLIVQLAQGVANSIPTLIQYIPTIVTNIAGIINDNAPKLLATGVEVLATLAQGIINAVPTLLANIPKIFEMLLALWSAFNWMSLGTTLVNGIKSGASALGSGLKSVGQKALETFKSINWADVGAKVVNFIHNGVTSAGSMAVTALKTVGRLAMNGFKAINWASVGKAAINFIKTAITGAGRLIMSALKSVGSAGMNAFRSINWASVGRAVITGIIRGISGAASALFGKLRSLASSALGAAKKALGIGSPSRVFTRQVGRWIPAGIAVGIDRHSRDLTSAVASMSDQAQRVGGNIPDGLSRGIANGYRAVRRATERMIDMPNLATRRLALAGADMALEEDYNYSADARYTIVVPVEIDGREAARVTAKYTKAELERMEVRDKRRQGKTS